MHDAGTRGLKYSKILCLRIKGNSKICGVGKVTIFNMPNNTIVLKKLHLSNKNVKKNVQL